MMADQLFQSDSLPIWGGIECTVHRLGDYFGDQLIRNGHHDRASDLKLIAELGIKTLRYPVLWERIAPQGLKNADWSWADERLNILRDLGINPIAGLLHHGSGPSYTQLIDPDFPQKFVEFAVAVAARYPWLSMFTPINEPLTTARFSCLYGVWYPHLKNDHAFSVAILNQCKAICIAMREIKKINSDAILVQTEDLGKCHSTVKLQYQANFENERRWASLDLLTGSLKPSSVMWKYFLSKGKIKRSSLEYFAENFYPPDIVGINYYMTSERFLDENRSRYPDWSYASNGKDKYSDVDIVRADIHRREGHYKILKSAAERYGIPIALTEVHLGSSRDAQLRWFMEAYKAAVKLKGEGVDIRAVTSWSLLGAYDWNSLLTQNNNFYESGAFDVRSGNPRPTAVAHLIKDLCSNKTPEYPMLQAEGWWKNPEHVHFEFGTSKHARGLPTIERMSPENLLDSNTKPILIIGATGTLGRAFAHICSMRNISYVLLSRKDLDITDGERVAFFLEKHQPWALVNAAGFVRVDEAESSPELCFRENTQGPAVLAQICHRYGVDLLSFSSDLVFDGQARSPYGESASVSPLNTYGVSKVHAEKYILEKNPAALIVRTSAFFGPWDEYNFIAQLIKCVTQGRTFLVAKDQTITPTYIPDLVNASLDLLIDKESGIWHLTNCTPATWYEFAIRSLDCFGLNKKLLRPVQSSQLNLIAKRPVYSALKSERGILLPNMDDAIERFFREADLSL